MVCVCVGIACTVCAHHVRGCLECLCRTLNVGAAELCTAKRGRQGTNTSCSEFIIVISPKKRALDSSKTSDLTPRLLHALSWPV